MRLITLHEYMELPDDGETWLIDNLLFAGGFNIIWGPPKSGKTILALDVALAIANGTPFHGRPVSQPGKVLLLEVDTPKKTFRKLLTNLHATRAIPPSPNLLTPHPDDLREMYPIDLRKGTSFTICEQLIDHYKPALVIIDCLAESGDIKENDEQEMKQLIVKIRHLTVFHKTAPCAVFLIHHTKKFSYNDPHRPQPSMIEAGRGSSYLGGIFDALWFQRRCLSETDPNALLDIILRTEEHQQINLKQTKGGWWDFLTPPK